MQQIIYGALILISLSFGSVAAKSLIHSILKHEL